MISDFRPDSKCVNLQRIANRNNHGMGNFRSIILICGEMAGKVFGYTCNSLILRVLFTRVLHAPHHDPSFSGLRASQAAITASGSVVVL